MEKIDARGLACPRPVMLTKEAVDRQDCEIQVLVDNPVAASNVERFLQKHGFATSSVEETGNFTVQGTREEGKAFELQQRDNGRGNKNPEFDDVAILICQEILGGSDKDLGEVLMKGFLSTLADRDVPPRVIALMNEGVKLALANHSASDSLKKLEQRAVTVLVCGTCTNHFGITDMVEVGNVSNMFEITESLLAAKRTITLG